MPPLIRRGDLGAAVLDGDAAERVVLALRVALPVVRHLDPGQRRMPVEDDAEEVPGLPLVPVAGRVHAGQRGNVRVGVRRADLQPHPAVVGDGQEVVHRVQLAADLGRVVHAGHAAAQLEAQRRVVAQLRGHLGQLVPADVQGQLAPVHHHALDGVGEAEAAGRQRVGDLVEVGAVRALAVLWRRLVHPEQPVARGVRGVLHAEHAHPHDRLVQPLLAEPGRQVGLRVRRRALRPFRALGLLGAGGPSLAGPLTAAAPRVRSGAAARSRGGRSPAR